MGVLNLIKNNKILIVQTGRIGDLILLLPVFESLKLKYPNFELHLLASRNNFYVAQNYPFIDKIHIYKKGVDILKSIYNLRKDKFDIWIDPKDHHSSESHFLARIGGAKYKIGFEKNKKIFDFQLQHPTEGDKKHVTFSNKLVLKPFVIGPDVARPKLFLNDRQELNFKVFCQTHKINIYYCVNLSGSKAERDWPNENWIQFLEKIKNDIQNIVIIASPAEKERAIEIAQNIENAYYFETKSINECYGIVADAQLVITPDTSIVHIASAFNTPILSMFSNEINNILKFGPLSSFSEMAITTNYLAPLNTISVEHLYASYQLILKRINGK